MWVRGFVIGVLISCILQLVHTKPFLHNALITLASSASASASSASTGSSSSERLTNIADYTKKREKVQQLQNEKQLAPDDDFNDDQNEKDNNEVSPSLIQKKINKILAKIQLLTSFTVSSSSSTETPDLELDSDDNNNNTTDGITEMPKSGVKIQFEDVTTKQPKKSEIIQKISSPTKEYGVPLRINLEINDLENIDNATDIEENIEVSSSNQNMNRIGQIGIFFVELFGSLVGLAYGAVAHLNNTIQGTGTPETAI